MSNPNQEMRKVTARRISPEADKHTVSGKEIKERLIQALNNFNIQGYMIPDIEDIQIHQYRDQDGHDNLILVGKDYVEGKNRERLDDILYTFYNNTYNSGTECLDKSRLLNRVMKTISPTVVISSTTLVSMMFLMNPYTNDIFLMSNFWYVIMKIANPEMFKA